MKENKKIEFKIINQINCIIFILNQNLNKNLIDE